MIKQYELSRGAKIKLDGEVLTFLHMDGTYGKWKSSDGTVFTGNFKGFKKTGEFYEIVNK